MNLEHDSSFIYVAWTGHHVYPIWKLHVGCISIKWFAEYTNRFSICRASWVLMRFNIIWITTHIPYGGYLECSLHASIPPSPLQFHICNDILLPLPVIYFPIGFFFFPLNFLLVCCIQTEIIEFLTSKQVQTVEGINELQIPPGTQPGDVLVLAKKGSPKLNKPSIRGDHLFTVKVTIPKRIRYSYFVYLF